MKILITGAAGFIGYFVSKKLIENGHQVVGLDNINDYYDVNLKYARLLQLGISSEKAKKDKLFVSSAEYENFKFIRCSLEDRTVLPEIFEQEKFDYVCNLAAQAGVRYSIENPETYIDSNIVGFLNILECCRNFKIKHLVYASSSSVYGLNKKMPFETSDSVDHPASLYAATKKSNELMAHTYSHLYNFQTTGLRFFTVYGPWGRPDMAIFLFTDAIVNSNELKIFNNGEMKRDFTYITDIANGVVKILESIPNRAILYKLYNIGNNTPVKLLDFIEKIEEKLDKNAIKKFLPMQLGDVKQTWANIDPLIKDYNYSPNISIQKGVSEFVDWYKDYYNISD